jgi:hypothetical protein
MCEQAEARAAGAAMELANLRSSLASELDAARQQAEEAKNQLAKVPVGHARTVLVMHTTSPTLLAHYCEVRAYPTDLTNDVSPVCLTGPK